MKKDINFSFRCITYQEKDSSFTGVCLDLDIVEEGHISLEEAVLSINEAIISHLQAAAKLKFPKELIDRPAPKEYWNRLKELTRVEISKKNLPTFQFFTTQPPHLMYA